MPTTKKCEARRADLIQVHDHCADAPYVELKVPSDAKSVTEVRFWATARDQGWADRKTGPSYTWFEAAVQRPSGRSDFPQINILNNPLNAPDFVEQSRKFDLKSRGHRRTWIEGLRPGDVVQLIPKAKYIAWVNIVKECRIQITYTVADAGDDLRGLHLSSNADHYLQQLDSDRGEIRLVVVEPGVLDDHIVCSWETVTLRDAPPFCALSYCWSHSGEQEDIHMRCSTGLKSFRVSRSVHEALRRLRYSDGSPLRIWIDAVCMNQDDAEERSQQVRLMRSIYSRAETVHIWLGDVAPAVGTCLRIIRDIYNYNESICPAGKGCQCPETSHKVTPLQVEKFIVKRKKQEGMGGTFKRIHEVFCIYRRDFSDDELVWAGGRYSTHPLVFMTTLFSNAWFSRVWVVQEATLAQRALVHGGDVIIPWNEVVQVSEWLQSRRYALRHQHIQSQTLISPIWRTIQRATRVGEDNNDEAPYRSPSILDIFLGGHDLRATDPRDKIFALMSFGKETNGVKQLDRLIQPSYSKSTPQVFADFTRWWIKEHRSLDILSSIHAQWGRTWRRTTNSALEDANTRCQHPTWALDSNGQSRWAHASLQSQFEFHATGDSLPDMELLMEESSNPLMIRLRGKRLSPIALLSHLPMEALYPYEQEKKDRKDISAVIDQLLDPCSFTGLWGDKVLKDNEDSTKARGNREFADHVRSHWAYANRPKIPVYLPPKDGKVKRYETDKIPTCMDKFFFVTKDGNYGLCPWLAKEGDVVALLDGGDVPYLLRGVNSPSTDSATFYLIGECFVEGKMYGEGESGRKSEVLELI